MSFEVNTAFVQQYTTNVQTIPRAMQVEMTGMKRAKSGPT